MTASGKSYRTCKTLDPMLTMEYIAAVREAYTGPDADWSRPCYSPLFADLRGLPPTLVQVGTNEILKSDSERLVENLQKAGVYAQLACIPADADPQSRRRNGERGAICAEDHLSGL